MRFITALVALLVSGAVAFPVLDTKTDIATRSLDEPVTNDLLLRAFEEEDEEAEPLGPRAPETEAEKRRKAAEKQRKADEKRRKDAQKKADEQRKKDAQRRKKKPAKV